MYEINAFFWYKAIFMLELLFAESMISFRLKKRGLFALRALCACVVCVGIAFAVPVLDDGALYATFMYLLFFAATVAALCFCFAARFKTILFCALAGYAAQHIAYEVFDITTILMGLHDSDEIVVGSNPLASFITLVYGSGSSVLANAFVVAVYISELFITYWAVFRITLPRLREGEEVELAGGVMLGIFALTMIFDIVISAIITERSRDNFDKVYVIVADVANIFCCGLALFMLFGMAKMRKQGNEIERLNRMWEQSKLQYEQTKQNIDMINFKCHDLKHQIRHMGKNRELDPEALAELEGTISIYDSNVKTGNAALDVIITEKSLYCNHRGITLSCIADGKQLDFISEPDIYAVFGNILDNAVEAIERMDPENRAIGISVKRIKNFVFVNIHNFYRGEIEFKDGLPVSTKGDAINHGFGFKSVKMLTEKYGGELKVTAKNGIFNTDLIFPR